MRGTGILYRSLGLFGKYIDQVISQGCAECSETGTKDALACTVWKTEARLIIRRASASEIRDTAIKESMTTNETDAARKITAQETTLDEFIRVMQE